MAKIISFQAFLEALCPAPSIIRPGLAPAPLILLAAAAAPPALSRVSAAGELIFLVAAAVAPRVGKASSHFNLSGVTNGNL